MFDLFYMGGPLFMGLLTLLLLFVIIISVRTFMQKAESADLDEVRVKSIHLIKSIGLLSLVLGMLGFLLGMYAAMSHIESSGGVSSGVLAGGLKVALITPTYGLIIYGISHLISIFLKR